MVLISGNTGVQRKTWHVDQKSAAGYCRIYYITGGDVTYLSQDIPTPLKHGHLYIFPSCSPYRIQHAPGNPICCFWLHLDLAPIAVERLIDIEVTAQSNLALLLQILQNEVCAKGNSTPFFLALVRSLVEYFYAAQLLPQPDPFLTDVLSYMQENYRDPSLNVTEISAHFHYTPEYFIRIFRAKMLVTPFQYLTRIRLNEAARLLAQGIPVKQAALLCGYADSKTFGYAFKQKYNVTPAKYTLYYQAVP